MNSPSSLRLAYYGDDFTGSTDALEVLTRAGLRTVLFIEPPTEKQLARFSNVQAVGVAGLTRSLSPAEMEEVLRPALLSLRSLGAPHVHYKVCSTFDSSPEVGSIGRAIDVAVEIFGASFVPVVVSAPALGRYCVFGTLFARMGIGTDGVIHRLDRHPVMSRHPVTPAEESDLRLHLGRQTTKRIALFDILHVGLPSGQARKSLEKLLDTKPDIVLFDAISPEHLSTIGDLLDTNANSEKPLFSVGSSGVEAALTAHWAKHKAEADVKFAASKAAQVLVVSGSCSSVTTRQIDWALANGFEGFAVGSAGAEDIEVNALAALRAGRNVVLYSNRGERPTALRPAAEVGKAMGTAARTLLDQSGVRRLVIAGGDTSSYAARALGIQAVDMIAPLCPGAPLCRAYSSDPKVDGLEVNFKGGQVGADDYFGAVARGHR